MTSAFKVKYALLYYYKFKRQFLCADEVNLWHMGVADVLADNKKQTHEIEVKVNKHDLKVAELKKRKHNDRYRNNRKINKFYICVPTSLLEDAKEWIEQVDKRYGLIEYKENVPWIHRKIQVRIPAKKICKEYNPRFRDSIINRLNNSVITCMGKLIND